jgi:ectoine hydroxylase-related dioxygenase (phytanoyl-CoA dioxygenase family)
MRSSTDLIGDPAALRARFDELGYAYLAGVLDGGIINSVRADMVSVLVKHGFATIGDDGQVHYTGKQTERFGIRSPRVLEEEYQALGLARRIVEYPAHTRLFEAVAGESVDFLPITEYRSRPPGAESLNWHQDGFYNEGLDLYTAWIPLADMDAEVGGLAVAEGEHKNGYLHASYPPPRYVVPAEAIPAGSQRDARFYAGDIVIFDRRLPHAGLPNNTADRFRLSIDVRFQKSSVRDRIVLGTITAHTPESLTITSSSDADAGQTVTLKLAEGSRLRDWWGNNVTSDELNDSPLGKETVLASQQDGTLILARPVLV